MDLTCPADFKLDWDLRSLQNNPSTQSCFCSFKTISALCRSTLSRWNRTPLLLPASLWNVSKMRIWNVVNYCVCCLDIELLVCNYSQTSFRGLFRDLGRLTARASPSLMTLLRYLSMSNLSLLKICFKRHQSAVQK